MLGPTQKQLQLLCNNSLLALCMLQSKPHLLLVAHSNGWSHCQSSCVNSTLHILSAWTTLAIIPQHVDQSMSQAFQHLPGDGTFELSLVLLRKHVVQ
eukprot:1780641-Amphidinium_carterae.1